MIIKISPEKNTIDINENLRVDVTFDTQRNSINAIGGALRYDPTTLKVESLQTGNSAVNFWIDQPADSEAHGEINFSGIIPGGSTAANGQVFSVIFSGIKQGKSALSVSNAEAYINDGSGTKASVQTLSQGIMVSAQVAEKKEYAVIDTTKPEKFEVIRARDKNVFEGNYFISFAGQDKESGIDHYEVCESIFGKCSASGSPKELSSQSSLYYAKVKAYDHAGNMRSETILSPLYIIFACVVIAIIAILTAYGVLAYEKRAK